MSSPKPTETDSTSRSRSTRSLVINIVLSAVAFGLLGLAIYSNREEIRGVLNRSIGWRLLAVAFGIYLTAIVLTFGRWFLLLRAVEVPLSLRDAIRLGFIGNVFNLVIPGAVGGDVVKAGFVIQKVPRERRVHGLASMVIDRLVGLLGLFLLAAVLGAITWQRTTPEVHRLTIVAGAASALGVLGLGVLFTPSLYRPLEWLLRGRGKLERGLEHLIAMAASFRARIAVVAGMVAMSSAVHSLFVLAFYLVGLALFGSVPSLFDHYVIVPLVLFTTAVPLPFGALGLTEQVSGQLFELVQHPGGAVAMMGFRLLMYAGAVVSVLVYLANLREVREAEHVAEEAQDVLDAAITSEPR
jgi:hypothetical protein